MVTSAKIEEGRHNARVAMALRRLDIGNDPSAASIASDTLLEVVPLCDRMV